MGVYVIQNNLSGGNKPFMFAAKNATVAVDNTAFEGGSRDTRVTHKHGVFHVELFDNYARLVNNGVATQQALTQLVIAGVQVVPYLFYLELVGYSAKVFNEGSLGAYRGAALLVGMVNP